MRDEARLLAAFRPVGSLEKLPRAVTDMVSVAAKVVAAIIDVISSETVDSAGRHRTGFRKLLTQERIRIELQNSWTRYLRASWPTTSTAVPRLRWSRCQVHG